MVLTEAGVDRVTFLTRKPQGVAIRDTSSGSPPGSGGAKPSGRRNRQR